MTDVGLDYAWSRPDLDQAWASGYRFVSRYVSYDTTGKNISITELQSLLAKGFQVALNWEWQATDQLGGAPLGTQHATEAVRQARALGYSAGCTIYFSADFDATEAQQQAINAYMLAAGQVVHAAGYRIGIYGGYWVVKRAFDSGVTDDGWQTYAWSGGQWDPRAAIRQDNNGITVGGAVCDHNTRVGQTYLMGPQQSTMEDEMTTQLLLWLLSGADASGVPNPAALTGDLKLIAERTINTGFGLNLQAISGHIAAIEAAVKAAGTVDTTALAAQIVASLPTATDIAKALIAELAK